MFPRPGVLRLLDQAQSRGLKTAICSAATKSSVEFVCEKLLGQSRVAKLDCFLAGDDVKEKKPSPVIYETAAQRMGIRDKRDCIVVEDSLIGVQVGGREGGIRVRLCSEMESTQCHVKSWQLVSYNLSSPPRLLFPPVCAASSPSPPRRPARTFQARSASIQTWERTRAPTSTWTISWR